MDFVRMPVLRTRGAQLLMVMRLMMALAFHMFAPVWQVSLKTRFDFGPPDHAKLMGMVGFSYALSQGLVARPLIAFFGKDPTKLILLCISILGGCRPFALKTASVAVVYMLYVPMVSRARAGARGRVVARVRARIRVRSSRRCTCPHP